MKLLIYMLQGNRDNSLARLSTNSISIKSIFCCLVAAISSDTCRLCHQHMVITHWQNLQLVKDSKEIPDTFFLLHWLEISQTSFDVEALNQPKNAKSFSQVFAVTNSFTIKKKQRHLWLYKNISQVNKH